MIRATNDFKKLYLEIKECYLRKIEQLQRERDALLSARVHSEIDDPTQISANDLANAKKVVKFY